MSAVHAVNVTGIWSGVVRASSTVAVTAAVAPIDSCRYEKSVTTSAGLPSRSESGSLLQPPTKSAATARAPKAPKRRRFMQTSLDDDARELKPLDVLHTFRAEQRLPVGPAGLAAVIRPYQRIVSELRQVHEHILEQPS